MESIDKDHEVKDFKMNDVNCKAAALEKSGLDWFDAKSESEKQVLLETTTIYFKVYKNCDSFDINGKENDIYGLTAQQTQELCEYYQVLKNSSPSKLANSMAQFQLSYDPIRSSMESYLKKHTDIINFALTKKENTDILEVMLEPKKLDTIDPIRHFIKIVRPTLLTYLDGQDLKQFTQEKAEELFQAVLEIFVGEELVNQYNIEEIFGIEKEDNLQKILQKIEYILQTHGKDLCDYIKDREIKYDPKEHYKLYAKYVEKISVSRMWGHFGFEIEHTDGLPLGTYYAEKDCDGVPSTGVGSSMKLCVEKCQQDTDCNACTIGNSFHDFRMVMEPHKCYDQIRPRDTYTGMALWIKNHPKELPLKAEENTKQQWLARRTREVSKLISDLVITKNRYAPKILIQTIPDTALNQAKKFKESHPEEDFDFWF
jgi:hypothetical protein